MSVTMRRNGCDVAVIGAGPYGLAAAAHLKAAKLTTRVFGRPMSFWEQHMPEGMKMRSPWVATHIAHPYGEFSLNQYAALNGFAPYEQMPIGQFIDYGHWFQSQAVPEVESRKVTRVEQAPHGFRLRLDDGEDVYAGRVVIAMGLAHQEFKPAVFKGLPQALVSHTSEHVNFDRYRGKQVAVVGRGQSACETAALLTEAGAEVELVSRGHVLWLGAEPNRNAPRKDLSWRVRKMMMTRGAVGPFPLNWLAETPAFVHLMPPSMRADFSTRCLRAKASAWLRPRVGAIRVNAGRTISDARVEGERVTLDFDQGSGSFDHVILGTGYKIDIAKLGILAPALLETIATSDGAPRLRYGMESSVPGLHFVGATAVYSFGPLMRFVWGAGFAASSLARAIARRSGRSKRVSTAAAADLLPARTEVSRM